MDAIGPYLANGSNNDANMTKDILTKQTELKNFFKPNDIFVVDRGFRDCIGYLNDLGLQAEMPSFLENASQHTTLEANQSRLVTKNRWVVESVNSIVKTWKYLDNVVINMNIPSIGDDFRFVCALINRYRPPRIKNNDDDDANLAQKMLALVNKKNNLKKIAEKNKRSNRNNKSCNIDELNFPALSLEYIKELTFGIYQLKQAKSYTQEHLNENGLYEFEFIPEKRDLVKIKLISRHLSNTIYTLFIQYDISNKNEPIKAYYCDCKAGARTIGCCAHIASALWYMGFAKYNPKLLQPTFSLKLFSYCKDAKS